MSITEQLENIQRDIVDVLLLENRPMTQQELHQYSELSLSEYGWSFALDKLEKKKIIKFVGKDQWRLLNRRKYISKLTLEEFRNKYIDHVKALQPDQIVRRRWSLFSGLLVDGEPINDYETFKSKYR